MQNEVNVIQQEKTDIKLPSHWNVIFFNDDVTPIGFVVELLINIFGYNQDNAIAKVLSIQEKGKDIVGTYIKSIADAKATLVREVSIKANYPLVISTEEI